MRNAKYYDILETSPHATDAEIRAAYRSLSRKYHPDTNSDADGILRFKLIQEAGEILTDSVKRARYDRQLANSVGYVSSLVDIGSGWMKSDSISQFSEGKSAWKTALPAEMSTAKRSASKSKLRTWKLRTKRASTHVISATGLLCSLCVVVLCVVRIMNLPERTTGVPASHAHGPAMDQPGGAAVKGNLAAWTEPAQPRFDEAYRVMLAVQLPDTHNTYRVNDLVVGRITRDDGFRRQIPFDAAAPNGSWVTTDDNSKRITSPVQTVTVSAAVVQFAFEIPATDRQTIETIQVRSNAIGVTEYWQLVVNRSR